MKLQLNEHQTNIQTLARRVWDSDEDAQKFLTTPHPLLDGLAPIEVARSKDGAAQVEAVLNKILWGLPR